MTCPELECPLDRFDATQSSTFSSSKKNEQLSIQYGIGSIEGIYGQDQVCLTQTHCVPSYTFGLATSTKDLIFKPTTRDTNTTLQSNGIFGIGNDRLSPNTPFIKQLVQAGVMNRAVFAIRLGRPTGGLILGDGMMDDTIEFEPVLENAYHYWMIGGDTIEVVAGTGSSVLYRHSFETMRGVIVDTGATLSYMDTTVVEDILMRGVGVSHVVLDRMSGTYLIDCQQLESDKKVEMVFKGGYRLSVPLKDLVIQQQQEDACLFGIAGWLQNDNNNVTERMRREGWILLGESMLRSSYIVFDMDNQRVGFVSEKRSSSRGSSRYMVCIKQVAMVTMIGIWLSW
ncbi:MAG: aspartic peptidase domain-containing protein [Benjaminiella poitrasii]|nr:MAG: aspartic peptidase domain-containing protein [Benjaminiella poitrasii]